MQEDEDQEAELKAPTETHKQELKEATETNTH